MKKAGAPGRVLAVVGIATAAACSGGAPTPTAPPAATPTLNTPAGTAIVARLPLDAYSRFDWSPDGRYVLVGSQAGSTVYDRQGSEVSQFHGLVDWLDESHVLGVDGVSRPVSESQGLGSLPNQWVVANGHGTAYIVVAVPGCTGDPIVNRYRNGKYERTQEKLSPFGFSPDGDLALEGHLTCATNDAELHGWKGDVDVVDVGTGKRISTLHDVRGPMSFDLYGKSLSAQSDADLVIATGGESQISTLKNRRVLAWTDATTLGLWGYPPMTVSMDNPTTASPVLYASEFAMRSPALGLDPGVTPALKVTFDGRVVGVDRSSAAGITSRLIDLTGEKLAIAANPAPGPNDRSGTFLLPRYWSPDGRMLALPTADGFHLVLVSVDPSTRGRFYETPLPWPSDWATPPGSSAAAVASAAGASPTTTLPDVPILTSTLTTDTRLNYTILVAPLTIPLSEETVRAWAKEIGALAGLTNLFYVYQDPSVADGKGLWRATFVQTWDGIPVAESSTLLEMRPDGTVEGFYRDTGPRAPKPAKVIARAQAQKAVPQMKVTDAELRWDRAGTDEYHLVWFLRHEGVGGGPDWGSGAWIDAGTGKILDTASVS